jgi:predicted DNA-binding protein with PD1-like motif
MKSSLVQSGRRLLVILDPGDDVLPALIAACVQNDIVQGYVPVFVGAFRTATLIGTHGSIIDSDAPLADSVVVTNVEGLGSGTIASGIEGAIPHLHVALGEKGKGAASSAGHLLSAEVQYVTEIVVEEIVSPQLVKRPDPAARGLANLAFEV